MTDNPPLAARIGCGLFVASALAVLLTCLGLWFAAGTAYEISMNARIYGLDGIVAYNEYLHSPEFRQRAGIILGIGIGSMIFVPLTAIGEAKGFLVWLKRR